MLAHLKLANFKICNSIGTNRLAPITKLLGTKFSGKSSLIHSLVLIRQTVKGPDGPSRACNILTTGALRQLGEFRTQRLVLVARDSLQAREAT